MTKIELTHCFFYLGEPARLRRSRFQAPQTPIYVPTSGNVVPSRRAVGLFATMFFVIRHRRGVCDTPLRTTYFVWAYRMRPHAKKHFRFNPSRAPVRDISPFRGEPSNPFACTFFPRREPRFRTFSRKNGNIVRICLQTCNRRRGWSRFRVLLALRVGESVKKCVCRFKTTASNRKRLHSLSR